MLIEFDDHDLDVIGTLLNKAEIGYAGRTWMNLVNAVKAHNDGQAKAAEMSIRQRIEAEAAATKKPEPVTADQSEAPKGE